MTGKVITDNELQQHNTPEDLWVAIHAKVFDLSDFANDHPGGWQVIEEHAGKDGTAAYESGEHMLCSIKDLKKRYIGEYEPKKLTLAD